MLRLFDSFWAPRPLVGLELLGLKLQPAMQSFTLGDLTGFRKRETCRSILFGNPGPFWEAGALEISPGAPRAPETRRQKSEKFGFFDFFPDFFAFRNAR